MIRVNAGSLKATLAGFDALRASEPKAARKAVIAAGRVLRLQVRHFGAIRDGHNQAWFNQQDNPYARRHGSIQSGTLGHPGWWVHYQTGRLLSAIHGKATGGTRSPGYKVFVDLGQAPHAKFVIQGTRVMMPRDFIWLTAQDPAVRKEMMRAMLRVMGKELRTKGSARFS